MDFSFEEAWFYHIVICNCLELASRVVFLASPLLALPRVTSVSKVFLTSTTTLILNLLLDSEHKRET
jgi:hypothetical protein